MKDVHGKEISHTFNRHIENEISNAQKDYELESIKFDANCLNKMPYLKDVVKELIASLERAGKSYDFNAEKYEVVINAKQKLKEYSEWEMMRSCDAPNKPGYYRANND